MDIFDIRVMLKNGSLVDFEVRSIGNDDFNIFKDGNAIIRLKANEDGTWDAFDNIGNVEEELQKRIINQLNGCRR